MKLSCRFSSHPGGAIRLEGVLGTARGWGLAGVLLFLLSCAPHGMPPGAVGDIFSRTYAVPFQSFHPRLNSALQEFAREHKGNSFQVLRLGSDGVVIRGIYQRDWDQARFFITLRVVPLGPDRTRSEIQISSSRPGTSSETLAMAAGELFQIIEDRTSAHSMRP